MSRILHLGKFYPPFAGGIESFLADLIPAQLAQGDTVAALVHDHYPQFKKFFCSAQAEIVDNVLIYRAPCYGRLLYAPISPQFPFWFNQVLQQFQPQILHLHLPNTSAFFALTLPRAWHIPWVIHWHADVDPTFNKLLLLAYHGYRPLEQRLLAKAKRIIVTSPPYLASSRVLQPWHDKCQVIPIGIAPSRLPEPTPIARQWAEQQWQAKKVRILAIGRLTYYKGHEILLQAMAQVRGAQAFIVGKGEQQRSLQTLIKQLNLTQQVKLLGYCTNEELTALLATCDIFCLPSLERAEAFGVVLLEAMRYEKAIIASTIPGSGTTWVVEDNHTGIGVPPHNIPALAQALQQLIDNPSLRINLGKAGYQRLKQRFDIIKIAEEIAIMYRQIEG